MVFVNFKKKYLSRWFAGLLLLTLILIPLSGFAQGSDAGNKSPVSVEVYVTPIQATVGDLITYSIRVRHDPNIVPYPPKFLPPEGLVPVDQGSKKLPPKKGQMEQEFWFRLRADQVGSYIFPPIPLPFEATRTGNESEKIPGHIATPKAELEVQSILRLQGEPTDIRDIKPLEEIGRDWLPWVLGIILAALTVALIVFLIRRRDKGAKVPSTSISENLSPQEAALRQLEILKNKGLLERGLVREYYFELSEIFRRFLGAKYQFQALDWTTEEIKDHLLRSSTIESMFKEKICTILEHTDLVKFAKAFATNGENMMEEIIIFIQATSRTEESHPDFKNTSVES